MILEVLEQFKMTADKASVPIHYQQSVGITGNWDRFKLEQALLNLLINALRYGENRPISISLDTSPNNTVLLSVQDQGIGIRPEDQARIFKRYERLGQNLDAQGMGLGLFITHNIIMAHGGKIHLESKINEGSKFTFELPLTPPFVS